MIIIKSFLVACCMLFSSQQINADSVKVVELTSNWRLTNQNGTILRTRLKIPTGVYSAYGADVLYGTNDVDLRWIAHDNWTYSTKFTVEKNNFVNTRSVNLVLHGIDTVAEIRLNHFFVGRTDNMFVRYSYDVHKLLLMDTENFLEIDIMSPIYAANASANALYNQTVPPNCPHSRYHGECHMNMLRKMQASFAWDWGLAAPSMGIWKTVALEYYEVAILRDVDVILNKNSTHWNMLIRVFMDSGLKMNYYANLTFYGAEFLKDPVVISHSKKPIDYKVGLIEFEQAIPIQDIIEWWPNGYGEQKLYPLHFMVNAWLDKNGPGLRMKSISHKSIRVGFRTLELVEESVGNGDTFYFKVNGVPIFMKGSNYIPSHILPELAADTVRIKDLLYAAKDAHMNMIRVWGGGIYESDYFYELADSFGILIWQDMMFACAMYPANENFLKSVRLETVQNAKRIGYHASIAIFATNNENEVALAQNWYGTFHELDRFSKEYRELYVATVLHELKIIESSARPSPLVSSPSNGKSSVAVNYLSDNPQDDNYGDVHFYPMFLKDGWDPNIYPRPRFVSEYGFQSLPMMTSWKRTMSNDTNLQELIMHRQHHPMAMLPITSLVQRHLPLPLPDDKNYPEALIYFSQIAQAMATKVETELYRSLRNTEHMTMGALYWQLNDVWVAPSWSSVDFYGNYKLLHYWAKEFMAPIAIVALYDSNTKSLNISLICDELQPNTADLEVTRNIYLWSDLYPKNSTSWSATLVPNGVQYDKVIPLKDILTDKFTESNCFLEFVLHRGLHVISRTYYFPTAIDRGVGIGNPQIEVKKAWNYCISTNSKRVNTYSWTVTVTRPAVFVFIEVVHDEVIKYKFSRNGYMQMEPVQTVHLEFQHTECINDLKAENLKVLTVNQFMKNIRHN